MALLYDANTDYMSFPWPASLDVDSLSVFGWFYFNTVAAKTALRITDGTDSLTCSFGWWSDTDEPQIYRYIDGQTAAQGDSNNATLQTATWYYIAWVLDNLQPKLYLGTLTSAVAELGYANQDTGVGTHSFNGNTAYIGNKDADDTDWPDGSIAMVHFCSSALSLAELKRQQFRPCVRSDSELLIMPGLHGVSSVPDLSGQLAVTVNGLTASNHVPLGPPFGFDAGAPYAVAAVAGAAGIMTTNPGIWGPTF